MSPPLPLAVQGSVGVGVKSYGDRGMAKALLNNLGVGTPSRSIRLAVGVAEVVEPDTAKTKPSHHLRKGVRDAVR